MVALFLGQVAWHGVPADEAVVRSTALPVNPTKEPAMMDDMPVMQEYESDSDPALGMNTRQLASNWHEGQKTVPEWIPRVDAVTDSTAKINEQVSSSGTAARREASGEVKKSMSYAVGIEPVHGLAGGAFGNDYFVREERPIQEGMDKEMSVPPGYDHQNTGQLIVRSQKESREASQASLYTAFWNGGK